MDSRCLRLPLVLIWLTCTAALAPVSATPPVQVDQGSEGICRVMSFNIRYGTAADGENAWAARRDLLIDTITAYDPDLLGTQECLDFQAQYLQSQLTGYGFVGAGRDDGQKRGEMCAIFYRKARFRKLSEGHFWLSETPAVVASQSWDAALTRMASWVQLEAREDSLLAFFFLNTHFDHVGALARLASARLLVAMIDSLASGLPTIVVGDFNAPADPHSAGPYAVLVGTEFNGPLRDTYRIRHPVSMSLEGTFNAFMGDRNGPRIDWILVAPDVEVTEATIDRTRRGKRYPSDHFPVTAALRLRSRTGRDRPSARGPTSSG
jgi:endonuclease/exonuclease/phosphatase family metal-dependent hydrolase